MLCVLSAIILAESVVAFDRSLAPGTRLTILNSVLELGIDGSRALLGGIGAATFGAAATAFSITVSVIATASTSYGPRLVGDFMADRKNQWILGTLVSTFVYTTLVLRTVRTATDDGDSFVPRLSVGIAILLAILNVFLIIAFIHHTSISIRVETLTAGVSRGFRKTLDRELELNKDRTERASTAGHAAKQAPEGGTLIRADREGYIIDIDIDRLVQALSDDGGRIALEIRVGERVIPGAPMARIWPAGDPEKIESVIRSAVAMDNEPETTFNPTHAQQQVLEIAVRALSPGTNDPYTAARAIEELAAPLAQAAAAPEPTGVFVDDHGAPRVYAAATNPAELIAQPFFELRPFIAGQTLVVLSLIRLASTIEQHARQELRGIAWQELEHCIDAAEITRDQQRIDDELARERRLVKLARGEK